MARSLMLLAGLVGYSAAAAVSVAPEANLFRRDPVPNKLGQCATYADLKWQPVLDFDRDGCYNVPAIGADGFLNPGMHCTESPQGGCRDAVDLDNNNVYSRSRCNNGWCAHMYGYYFEKDTSGPACNGHRHDWEHIVVWTKNDQPQYVSVSAHGGFKIKHANDVRWTGTHPKVVYHKDGGLTHAFRFANADDEAIENHRGVWFAGTLVSYYGFPSVALREKMLTADWGAAAVDLRDARIEGALNRAKPGAASAFQSGRDAPDGHNSPGRIDGCGSCC